MKQFTIQIRIHAEPDNKQVKTKEQAHEEACLLIEKVARLMRQGHTGGAYPNWDLTITEN